MTIEPKSFFMDAPTIGSKETHRLALYEWENRSASKGTVFCVHGLTRNGRDFDTLAIALSENYRVISLDVAGRGKSEWYLDAANYSYPSYLTDIGFVISKLGLKNIHWIGSSMGGILGMMVANQFPKLLKTLTLNDIGCMVPAAGLKRIAAYVGTATNFPSRALAEEELRRRCGAYGIKNEEDWQHLFTYSIEKIGNGHVRLAYDPDISKGFTAGNEISDISLWQLWDAVKPVPTLLIRGMQSDLLTHDTAMEMQKTHPDFALLEVENVGHAPALIDAQQVNTIKEWIGKHS